MVTWYTFATIVHFVISAAGSNVRSRTKLYKRFNQSTFYRRFKIKIPKVQCFSVCRSNHTRIQYNKKLFNYDKRRPVHSTSHNTLLLLRKDPPYGVIWNSRAARYRRLLQTWKLRFACSLYAFNLFARWHQRRWFKRWEVRRRWLKVVKSCC